MIPAFTKGDRLRKAREEKGLSQFDIAERIGIGRASVQNYETDRTEPKALIVKQWALATGVPVYWLQWGMDEAPTGPMPDRGFGELQFTGARPEGFEPPTFWLGATPAYATPGSVTDIGSKRAVAQRVERRQRLREHKPAA